MVYRTTYDSALHFQEQSRICKVGTAGVGVVVTTMKMQPVTYPGKEETLRDDGGMNDGGRPPRTTPSSTTSRAGSDDCHSDSAGVLYTVLNRGKPPWARYFCHILCL